jgi:small-conductance mechanosensitive channel
MIGSSLTDVSRWARTNGLEIVILVTGSILTARAVAWFGDRAARRIEARSHLGDPVVSSEDAKHRRALAQAITWTLVTVPYFVAGVLVVDRLDVPLATLVAPATVAGVALGFGAQRIVQDLLGGFFVITERQYGYGDVIRVLQPGSTTGVLGTVEDLTLRITRLRTATGEVLIVPNGDIRQVVNLSRDWARAVIDVPVTLDADLNQVTTALRSVCEDAYADPSLHALLLDAPTVMGVESLELDHLNVRVVARTLPGKQFEVARRLRERIADALRSLGMSAPASPSATPAGMGGERGLP